MLIKNKSSVLLIGLLFNSHISLAQPFGIGRAFKRAANHIEQEVINLGDSLDHIGNEIAKDAPWGPGKEKPQIVIGKDAERIYPFIVQRLMDIIRSPERNGPILTQNNGHTVVSLDFHDDALPDTSIIDTCRELTEAYHKYTERTDGEMLAVFAAQWDEFECYRHGFSL